MQRGFIHIIIGIFLLSLAPIAQSQTLLSCIFTRSLTIGTRGEDVICLQQYLTTTGHFMYAGGATGYFGPITRAAVAKWQAANGVLPSVGYFGPLSQAKYHSLILAAVNTKTAVPTSTNTSTVPTNTSSIIARVLLPAVSDAEITIDSGGVNTVESYISYFVNHSKEILFDDKKFNVVLKDQNGIFLFVPQLIERVLTDGKFSEIHDSLLVHKEFLEAKMVFLKSIKVFGEATTLNKKMIAFDKLTLELIQKALSVERGMLLKTDLADFYTKYDATATYEHKEFLKQFHSSPFGENKGVLQKLIAFLGLEKVFFAFAIGLPFGGPITPILCTCSFGYWIIVGPPKPASLFISIAFIATPLFFEYKSLRPGAWWLGLYSPGPIPCLQIAFPACIPIGQGNAVEIVGTSM